MDSAPDVEALSRLEPTCPPPVTFRHLWWHSLAAQVHFLWRMRANQLVVAGLVWMAYLSAGGMRGLRTAYGLFLFVATLGISIAFLLAFTLLLFAITYSPSRNRSVQTMHTITLTERGVIEETAFNRNEVYWAGVDRVSAGTSLLYISPAQFSMYVIPRSAFAKERRALPPCLPPPRSCCNPTDGRTTRGGGPP